MRTTFALSLLVSACLLYSEIGAVEKPLAPASSRSAGETLDPKVEKALKWGEPVNGLRAAVVLRRPPSDPKPDASPDLYLVVQNVSTAPLHFLDAAPSPRLRELRLKIDGKIQFSLVIKDPSETDVVLRPREVAYLSVLPADSKSSDGQRVGSVIAEGLLKDPHQSAVVLLDLPACRCGSWTGKLSTGDATARIAGVALDRAPRGRE